MLLDRPPATPAAMLFPDSRGSAGAESTQETSRYCYKATKTEYRSFTLPGRGKSSQATESLGKTKSDECGPFLDSMKVEFLFIESI